MVAGFQFQVFLLLALILASSAFTICSDRATTPTLVVRNNAQHMPRISPTIHPNLLSCRRSHSYPILRSAAVDDESSSEESESKPEGGGGEVEAADAGLAPVWKRIVFFNKYNKDGTPKSQEEEDGLTFRQKLAKMGLSVLLSYGFVSNMSYCVTVSLAWFGFSKKTGLSPLAPGQWKGFLAVYAGFYVFNNFIRPMRLAASVGVAPYFERAVNAIQEKTKLNKGASIGIVVFLANVCGTTSLMSLGIYIASLAAGIPVFPPKA
mmetsp:Transcript_12020/g.30467  ORF Transcript_12020/g.30467 Transcript_12020/m.30467 type:complete len:264 (-) Transcript_12020:149-940(-)